MKNLSPKICIFENNYLSLQYKIKVIKIMARKIELTTNECNVLLKVTHRAKMNWFDIDIYNRCRDLENNNRIISTRKAVKQIVEGLTEYDIHCLTHFETLTLLNLLNRM